jgi:hypothetical protein
MSRESEQNRITCRTQRSQTWPWMKLIVSREDEDRRDAEEGEEGSRWGRVEQKGKQAGRRSLGRREGRHLLRSKGAGGRAAVPIFLSV